MKYNPLLRPSTRNLSLKYSQPTTIQCQSPSTLVLSISSPCRRKWRRRMTRDPSLHEVSTTLRSGPLCAAPGRLSPCLCPKEGMMRLPRCPPPGAPPWTARTGRGSFPGCPAAPQADAPSTLPAAAWHSQTLKQVKHQHFFTRILTHLHTYIYTYIQTYLPDLKYLKHACI